MFEISHLPERTTRPRTNGLTMVMDKGLSLRQAEDLIAVADDRVDFLKLGFGTSLFTPDLKEKVKLYREAGMDVYCGGTLFEAFLVRNCLDDYLKFIDSMGIGCLEISDGSMVIEHGYKCELIQRLSKDFKVLSEVGSKEEGILISPAKWIKMMRNELDAGSVKVIAEARESGTVGIYRPNGSAHTQLIRRILADAPRFLSEHGVLLLEIGHERPHFEAAFPNIQPIWLATATTQDSILLLERSQLTPA